MFEALSHPWWLFVLVGVVSGMVSATFGVGSGIILVPTLVMAFSLPQKSAQGVCLAVMVPMALVGSLRYIRNPDIDVNLALVLVLAIGAVIGAVIGSSIAGWVSGLTLRRLFAIIMIVAAVRLLMPKKVAGKPDATGQPPATAPVDATMPPQTQGHGP